MSKMNRKRMIIAVALICAATAAAASGTARAALTGMITLIAGAPSGDAEQRARAKHGWNDSLVDSVIRGRILDYDENGMLGRIGTLTLYRKYPDKLRIEIERNGALEVAGVDGNDAWKYGADSLTSETARDIRSFLRIWPERLFMSRSAGAKFQDAGRRTEDRRAGGPTEAPADLDEPIEYEVVEIEDRIGRGQPPELSLDQRRIFYYISKDSLVSTIRWLEPDDPRQSGDSKADATDLRVDFGDWQQVAGVYWPMEIVHHSGGRIDYRIEVQEVKVNQGTADSRFTRSGQ